MARSVDPELHTLLVDCRITSVVEAEADVSRQQTLAERAVEGWEVFPVDQVETQL